VKILRTRNYRREYPVGWLFKHTNKERGRDKNKNKNKAVEAK
jgi:hypothetical protein